MVPERVATRSFLRRLRAATAAHRVRFTAKAEEELEALGWEITDAYEELANLGEADCLRREVGRSGDHPEIWVFCPTFWDGHL